MAKNVNNPGKKCQNVNRVKFVCVGSIWKNFLNILLNHAYFCNVTLT